MVRLKKKDLALLSRKRSDSISLAIVLLNILIVILPILIAAISPLGWYDILLWLWFGLSANSLASLLHECSHFLIFRDRNWSIVLGTWILGPFLLTDFKVYRKRHMIHHKLFGEPEDTKKTYLNRIDGWYSIILCLKIMLFFEAIQAVFRQLYQLRGLAYSRMMIREKASISIIPFLFFHGVFAIFVAACIYFNCNESIFALLLHWAVVYIGIYFYGLASLTVLMAYIRGIAEHSPVICEDGRIIGRAALRTIKVNSFTKYLFGAYGFDNHAAHHLYPIIPYYRLPEFFAYVPKDLAEFQARYGYLQLILMGMTGKRLQAQIEQV